jgi:hypothetical protein
MRMAHTAHIVGKVEFREGDGPNMVIRPGPVSVETGLIDATLSWEDEETHNSAAMPLVDFTRYIDEGKITLAG